MLPENSGGSDFLGRLHSSDSTIEDLLPFLLQASTSIEIFPAYAIFSTIQYSQKKDVLRAIHETDVFPELPFRVEVLDFVARLQNESELRNKIAHSTWVVGNKPDRLKSIRMKTRGRVQIVGFLDDTKEYSLNEFEGCGDRLENLAKDIRKFIQDHDIGLLDE